MPVGQVWGKPGATAAPVAAPQTSAPASRNGAAAAPTPAAAPPAASTAAPPSMFNTPYGSSGPGSSYNRYALPGSTSQTAAAPVDPWSMRDYTGQPQYADWLSQQSSAASTPAATSTNPAEQNANLVAALAPSSQAGEVQGGESGPGFGFSPSAINRQDIQSFTTPGIQAHYSNPGADLGTASIAGFPSSRPTPSDQYSPQYFNSGQTQIKPPPWVGRNWKKSGASLGNDVSTPLSGGAMIAALRNMG